MEMGTLINLFLLLSRSLIETYRWLLIPNVIRFSTGHSSADDEHTSSSRSPYVGPVSSGTGVESYCSYIVPTAEERKLNAVDVSIICAGVVAEIFYANSDQVIY